MKTEKKRLETKTLIFFIIWVFNFFFIIVNSDPIEFIAFIIYNFVFVTAILFLFKLISEEAKNEKENENQKTNKGKEKIH